MNKRKAARAIDILAILALVVTTAGWLGLFEPKPFKNVRDVSVTIQDDGTYLIQSTYQKTSANCKLILPIMVFGWTFGERIPVLYDVVRQENQTAQRFEGQQLMTLIVEAQARALDRIEVWTRHDCNGRRVDAKMLDVEI